MNLTPVAVNEKISRLTSELSGEPVDIYYGLPNAREFSPAVSPRTSETVRLCLIGNLADPCKGTDVAIKAFMALPEDVRARAELHLASFKSPPEMPHENIIAHAWKPASEIPAFLQEMDVMLVPSVHETFSQAIVQGMLTALPAIASPLPALIEKLDTGGGFICESFDDYVRTMTILITDREKRLAMGEIARTTAIERYVWDTEYFVRKYLFPANVTSPAQ